MGANGRRYNPQALRRRSRCWWRGARILIKRRARRVVQTGFPESIAPSPVQCTPSIQCSRRGSNARLNFPPVSQVRIEGNLFGVVGDVFHHLKLARRKAGEYTCPLGVRRLLGLVEQSLPDSLGQYCPCVWLGRRQDIDPVFPAWEIFEQEKWRKNQASWLCLGEDGQNSLSMDVWHLRQPGNGWALSSEVR